MMGGATNHENEYQAALNTSQIDMNKVLNVSNIEIHEENLTPLI